MPTDGKHLTRAGLVEAGAIAVAEVQFEASMRGQPTHDMVSIPRYARRIAAGIINPRPQMRIERETATSALLDGDNGPGQWVATVGMELAIRKAREAGVGVVSVRRSNHFGAAGHYVWQATRAGLIGLCTTNGPLILAPTGGVTPTFGNNPVGVGIPAGDRRPPVLLDIAMSVAPRGKIGLHVAEGRPLPPGWILDRRGRPSTDLADLAAGLGMPIGGTRATAWRWSWRVLAGVLSGAGFCADHHRDRLHADPHAPDFGHCFLALDPALFMDPAEFARRVDHLIEQTKSAEVADGVNRDPDPGRERDARPRAEPARGRPAAGVDVPRAPHLRARRRLDDPVGAGRRAGHGTDCGRMTDRPMTSPTSQPLAFDRTELDGTVPTRFARVVRNMFGQ